MELERKTVLYMFLGVLLLTGAVTFQERDVLQSDLYLYIYLDGDPDNAAPNLVVEESETETGSMSVNSRYFAFSGHYVKQTALLEEGFREGLVFFKSGNDNFMRKTYPRILEGSVVKISAFNSYFYAPRLNESRHCEKVKMSVFQDQKLLKTFNVTENRKLENFRVEPEAGGGDSSITLRMSPNQECEWPQFLGVDSFQLEEPRRLEEAFILNVPESLFHIPQDP